jgi:hypothetical protein
MIYHRIVRTFTAAAIAAATLSESANAAAQDGDVSVQASPAVMTEPGAVQLLIQLERDAANRALVVEVDSQDLFRSDVLV